MEDRSGEPDRANDASEARQVVLYCFTFAVAWIAILLILRAIGWLPDEVAASPRFGWLLAIGMPVGGVTIAVIRARARRLRALSSG